MTMRSAVLAATLSVVSTAAFAAAKVGEPAPDFKAVDSKGKPVSLSEYKGKVVMLEWHNKGCPYVRKHYDSGNMQGLQKAYGEKGVVWLSVISSAKGKQGHVTGKEAEADFAGEKASPTRIVLDPGGTVGRLYGAKTTPHMYVVDAKGVLRYNGAIDSEATADPGDIADAEPYAAAALDAVLAGKKVKRASTKPYGCSVKYAK